VEHVRVSQRRSAVNPPVQGNSFTICLYRSRTDVYLSERRRTYKWSRRDLKLSRKKERSRRSAFLTHARKRERERERERVYYSVPLSVRPSAGSNFFSASCSLRASSSRVFPRGCNDLFPFKRKKRIKNAWL